MKKFISLLLIFIVLSVGAQNDKIIYLKLNDSIAEYPGIKDFKIFKNKYPQFNAVIHQFNISDIKCIFRTKSKRIQSIYYVTVPASVNEQQLIKNLRSTAGVEYVERPLKYKFSATVNDPEFVSEQWNLTKIQAPEAWGIYAGGTAYKTKIAIIDAGFNTSHEDLSANFWHNTAEIPDNGIDDDGNGWIDDYNGWDVANDDKTVNLDANETDGTYGHGTFVCGFAAAMTNNNTGIASVSHNNAEIIPIKVGNNDINGNIQIASGTLPYGMDYAINNGAEIISMSISSQYDSDLGDYAGQTMHEFVQEAVNNGIIVAAATGNNAINYTDISYPARYPEVIAVGSTDENDYKASSSQYSTSVDIMAPGHLVYSTIQASPWYQGGWSGTSFSTPTVASALALMKSFQPTASVEQLKQCLYSGADDIESIGANTPYIGKLGHGRLNVYNSMRCLDSIFNPTGILAIKTKNFQIYPNPASNNVQLIIDNEQLGETIQILDITGKTVKPIIASLVLSEVEGKAKQSLSIDISNLQNGIYFVKVGNTVQKFIKK